jgi:hypothetical protein
MNPVDRIERPRAARTAPYQADRRSSLRTPLIVWLIVVGVLGLLYIVMAGTLVYNDLTLRQSAQSLNFTDGEGPYRVSPAPESRRVPPGLTDAAR